MKQLLNKQGLSMVEVMIGAILLALIVIPSLNVISTQTQTVTATRDHSQAAFVAQKLQEIMRSYRFNMLDADQYDADHTRRNRTFEWKLKNSDELKRHVINGIEYLIDPAQTSVEPVKLKNTDPASPPTAYLVRFSITYKSKDSRNHLLNVSTAISQRE